MVRMQFSVRLEYTIIDYPADLILNIHAAQTSQQTIVTESLVVNRGGEPRVHCGQEHGSRHIRLRHDPGTSTVQYDATVDIDHLLTPAHALHEMRVADLSTAILPFVYPSRYCPSDRLRNFAAREFGHLEEGYGRIRAIEDWVRQRTTFKSGCSDDSTSALDTLVEQRGVCRDFAHLMIALCRAINIPARLVTGIDYGAPVEYGPSDFHAYVEVLLSGRWYIFDPSGMSPPMGLIRIGTGRDAADVSFATLFGAVTSSRPLLGIEVLEGRDRILPSADSHGVSTSG
jgi:transglutaminase-like putative cysteine protease